MGDYPGSTNLGREFDFFSSGSMILGGTVLPPLAEPITLDLPGLALVGCLVENLGPPLSLSSEVSEQEDDAASPGAIDEALRDKLSSFFFFYLFCLENTLFCNLRCV